MVGGKDGVMCWGDLLAEGQPGGSKGGGAGKPAERSDRDAK